MAEPTQILELQAAIVARLEEALTGTGIPVYSRRTGSLSDKLNSALARIGGLAVMVAPPMPTEAIPNLTALTFKSVAVEVIIYDNPTMSGDVRDASTVAAMVENALHAWKPTSTGAGLMTIEKKPRTDESEGDLFILRSHFSISLSLTTKTTS